MAGRAEEVIFNGFFRVQKIDKQRDEEEPDQKGKVKDFFNISHCYPIFLNIHKNRGKGQIK